MLTKDDLEQIGRLLQAQNENTKQLIEASEKRLTTKIDQGNEQILDTIIRTTDGVIDEVKKGQEKLEKRVERLEEDAGITHKN